MVPSLVLSVWFPLLLGLTLLYKFLGFGSLRFVLATGHFLLIALNESVFVRIDIERCFLTAVDPGTSVALGKSVLLTEILLTPLARPDHRDDSSFTTVQKADGDSFFLVLLLLLLWGG